MATGSTGRFLATWVAVIKAGYSFITSPELIVACAAEVKSPRVAVPRCASRFIYRLAFFYILGSLVIGIIANSNNDQLINGSHTAAASPFVLGIQNAGIPVLNNIINAVILTSAASAGNAFIYAASRTLFSLSQKGLAPKIFSTVNKWGVPYPAILLTFAISCLAYLNVTESSTKIFAWLTNITTISGFIAWIVLGFTYLRWREAIVVQSLEDRVPYKTKFQPYGAYFVIVLIFLVTLTNGFTVFFEFNTADFVAAYVTFPIILSLYFGHRIYSIFWLGRKRWLIPLSEIDFTKVSLVEYQETQYEQRIPKHWWEKICNAIF